MRTALTYDDVLLVPKYSDIESRTEITLDSALDNKRTLTLPIISSPMDTVTGDVMASTMSASGGLGIIHRYNTPDEQATIVAIAKKIANTVGNGNSIIGAAVGVSGDYLDRARKLAHAGVDVICIDIAHGHHILMQKAIRDVRTVVGNRIHIMAGNVATREGYEDLCRWGADSVRANVGSGCFTAGTLVRTISGDKPIEQVGIGDKVYTHTGEVRPVVNTLTFDRDEEIAVINGIETTTNHEFYVVEKNDLDKITDENISDYAKWIEAEHLDKSRHLLIEVV